MTENKRFFLLEWRKFREMSQEQLAELSKVAQGTISAIETNPLHPRRPVTLGKLARALGIEPTDLRRNPYADSPERMFDLQKWLSDPNAAWKGRPVSEEDKKMVEAIFYRLYNEQQKR